MKGRANNWLQATRKSRAPEPERYAMTKNDRLPIVIRVLGPLGGFIGGGIIGTILIILAILVTDSTMGLNNIWPGALVGAIVGAILGSCFPRIGKTLAEILTYL